MTDVVGDLLAQISAAYAGANNPKFQREYVTPGERARNSYVTARPVGVAKRAPYGVNPHYLLQLVSVDIWGQTDMVAGVFETMHEAVEQTLEDIQAGYTAAGGQRYAAIELTGEQDQSGRQFPHFSYLVNVRWFKDTS